jgi:ADP-ribose pyrophosphatase YjhB (NUDIX family)
MSHARQDVSKAVRGAAIELRALARSGLHYTRDADDTARLLKIAQVAQVLSDLTLSGESLRVDLQAESVAGYTTPMVDVRGVVFDSHGRVLLVRDDPDTWTVPGGWCDVQETPSEAVIREVSVASGMTIIVTRLAAVLDRELWGHSPPYDSHVYKFFFVCKPAVSASLAQGIVGPRGIYETGWFELSQLPELSRSGVTEPQLALVYARYEDELLPPEID